MLLFVRDSAAACDLISGLLQIIHTASCIVSFIYRYGIGRDVLGHNLTGTGFQVPAQCCWTNDFRKQSNKVQCDLAW